MHEYVSITRCRACHARSGRLRPVLAMASMPLAGAFSASEKEARGQPSYPLTLMQCGVCTVIQVIEDISDDVLFSAYNYASSTIDGLVRHFAEFGRLLSTRYGAIPITFLEIGCNDGVLLNQLPSHWRLVGVDPSDVARRALQVRAAYELINLPFALHLVEDNDLVGRVDVISASNCLAHISDVRAVFEAAHTALRDNGEFWVEVHDLDALLRGTQWDSIYHEHRLEWSTRSLQYCLQSVGFEVVQMIHRPLHGGLLRCCFRKTPHRRIRAHPRAPSTTMEADGLEALRAAYGARYETPVAIALRHALKNREPIAAYGASGRGSVYLNQLPDLLFSYVVDESPVRFGRFVPGVAVPVVTRDIFRMEPPTHCLITAWNYADDIVQKNPQYRGHWLTAFGAA